MVAPTDPSARKEVLRYAAPPSTTAEDGEHHLQTPNQPRLHLHGAADEIPNSSYAMYTPEFEVSPASRRRSGRRRRGNRRIVDGEVDLTGVQKYALYCSGRGGESNSELAN
jgi:hypothetical protein